MDLMNKMCIYLYMYLCIYKYVCDLIWGIGGIMLYIEYIFMIKLNIIEVIFLS